MGGRLFPSQCRAEQWTKAWPGSKNFSSHNEDNVIPSASWNCCCFAHAQRGGHHQREEGGWEKSSTQLTVDSQFVYKSQWRLPPKFKCESMRYLRRIIIIIIIIGSLIITPLFINKQLPWIISQRERGEKGTMPFWCLCDLELLAWGWGGGGGRWLRIWSPVAQIYHQRSLLTE